MADEGFKRKLTAILSADVEGYSRLMGEDEDATIRTLTAYRELMSTIIQKHHGRVVDSPGDNLLAGFLSVVDAVRCAVEIQEELRVRNAELPENRRMVFRIGINLGDVVEEGERIYGDGVNITARVEGLAEGGGICISGTVYDSIKNKLSMAYDSLGEHTVKNIKEPVRVYRMRVGPDAAAPGVSKEKRFAVKRWQWAAMAAVVVLIVGAVAVWNFYFRLPSIEPASVEKMAFSLPDKPSIAVLPFDNMSGDPEQDFIADGFTENIITGLSQIPEMFVIARSSVFTYKGKPVKIRQVSEELGVRYVLEGSVQKAGDRIRITAQLIDALKGGHLWTERFDREIKDLFKLQDEITLKVVKALHGKLMGPVGRVAFRTDSFEAWSLFVKGIRHFDRITKMDNQKAKEYFEKALKLDPDYPLAWLFLAWSHLVDGKMGFSDSPGESIKRAVEIKQKTSENWPAASRHSFTGEIYSIQKQYEKSIAEKEKALALAPNSSREHISLAWTLDGGARPEEAIVYAKKAMRLEPYYPAWFLTILISSYDQAGSYDEALTVCKQLLERAVKGDYPLQLAHLVLAAGYARLDRMEEARSHAAELRKIVPKFSIKRYHTSWRITSLKDQKYLDSYTEMLRKAGLPD
jgi:TolB-like protein/class 3 adenylate cyclase/Tfp pilus assembly protein PilF